MPGIGSRVFDQINTKQRFCEGAQSLQHRLQGEVVAKCLLGNACHVLANFFSEIMNIPRLHIRNSMLCSEALNLLRILGKQTSRQLDLVM